jgi:iron complex outermembrane receptor protein
VYYLDADHMVDTVLLLGPTPYTPLPVVRSTETSKAAAGFGQTNIDLSDRMELTLALRYDQDRRTLTDRLTAAPDRSHTFNAWQPKVSLSYRLAHGPASDSMVYATAARGFRSGGFNAPNTMFQPIYNSELTTSYELGVKSSWLEDRLQANAAVFYTNYDNQQVFVLASGAVQGIVNVAKTRLDGAELELRAKPTAHLELDAAISRIDSRIQNFNGTSTFVGNKVPLTYGWSSNLSAQYTFQAGPAVISLWGGYERRTDNYWHIDNADKQAPVDLVKARIAVDVGSWRTTLWAQNLLNKAYTEEFFAKEYAGTFNDIRYPGNPRLYGVSLLYRF